MKILHLELSGIGPFGGTHRIDFAELSSSGIFLLEGPTGSGKSTIIDALVFALYGGVAGSEASDERLRSTHADPHRASWVDLIFEVSSGIYRVRRYPQWHKPKTRGTGTTLVSSDATLWRVPQAAIDTGQLDAVTPLASKSREVNEELKPILGLTKKQFVQTVVLPQGQFADFLRLKSDARSVLLETLFDTRSYSEFTETLVTESRTARVEIASAKTAFDSAVQSWLSIDAVTKWSKDIRTIHDAIVDSSDGAILDAMRERGDELNRRAQELEEHTAKASEAERDAAENLRRAQDLDKALKERAELLAKRAEIDNNEASIREAREKVAQHRGAEKVFGRLKDLRVVQADLSESVTHAVSSITSLLTSSERIGYDALAELRNSLDTPQEKAEGVVEHGGSASTRLAEVASSLGEDLGTLKALAQDESRIPKLTAEVAQLDRKLEEIESDSAKLMGELGEIPERIEALEEKRATQVQIAQGAAGASAELPGIERLLRTSASLAKVEATQPTQEAWLTEALERLDVRRADLSAVTDRWIRSTAAELATELTPGEACPVCGSLEHPAPAVTSEGHATRADVDREQDRFNTAKDAVAAGKAKLAEMKGQAQSLRDQLGEATEDSLTSRRAELTEAITRAESGAKEEKRLARELSELAKNREKLQSRLSSRESERSATSATRASKRSEIEAIRKRITDAVSEGTSVAELRSSLEGERKAIDAARRDIEATVSVTRTFLSSQAAFESALAESEHETAKSVESAILGTSTLAELTTSITAHEGAVAKIAGRLEAPDLAKLTGEEDPKVEESRVARTAASGALDDATRASTTAARSAADASRLLKIVEERQEEWSEATERSGAIVRLANLANADSLSLTKIPLHIWVLLKRFEIVLERANEHLRTFSRSRYELVRTDEGERERKTGLGLEVIDHNGSPDGDIRRSPGSLSGGETFYTSLSLALALAEVVQEENGGVRIETLLIDEGFGTLSQDVREIVMQTLSTLTNTGRAVGIVSHVEELKQMVPNRIEIRPAERGGSTLQVIA